MVECKKCGYENKLSGKCKNCGTVNAPKYTIPEIISNMSSFQQLYAIVAVIIYVVYAIFTSIALFGLIEKYELLVESGEFEEKYMPVVVTLVIIGFILILGIVFCAVMAYIKQGIFASVLQGFWFCGAAFSIWAIGAINYYVFMIALLSSVLHAALLTIYRGKFTTA